MKKLFVLSITLLLCGCNISSDHSSIVGEWETTDKYNGATILSNYDEEGNFTLEYILEDTLIYRMESEYQVYEKDEGYDKLTEDHPLRWQETLVDTIIDLKDEFTTEHLLAIELTDIKVYEDGEIVDSDTHINEESLGLAFISEDGNTLYVADRNGPLTIDNEDYFVIEKRTK